MNRDRAFKILELEGHKNIVKVVKPSGYFLDEHSHDFDVDLIVLSGKLDSYVRFKRYFDSWQQI